MLFEDIFFKMNYNKKLFNLLFYEHSRHSRDVNELLSLLPARKIAISLFI